MEQRANIKFCFKLGKKFTGIYELFKKVYGDDCMSRIQVRLFLDHTVYIDGLAIIFIAKEAVNYVGGFFYR